MNIDNNKNNIFDFDGTLITHMNIDYVKMKNELKLILKCDNMDSMYESIRNHSKTDFVKKECYDLIDKYELNALYNVEINSKFMDMYLSSPYKIIVSRNGLIPITHFLKTRDLPLPDFISCRDNCLNLKPDTEQIDVIFQNFNNLNKDNIIIIGDSWHDSELAKNIGCEFLDVTKEMLSF
jgi:histidinol phosphatase-like enzyme